MTIAVTGFDGHTAGGTNLPKQSRPGVNWLTTRVPSVIHDAIRDLAEAEGRSMSNMALRLFEEALRARGVDVTKHDHVPDGDGASD